MKMSISLPEHIAKEIRELSIHSERSVSWWIQRAWTVAREEMQNPKDIQIAKKASFMKLQKLEGTLKLDYPKATSVDLAHTAFRKKK